MCPGIREAHARRVLQLESRNISLNCRYRVHTRHIDRVPNLPSDFGSRNPRECHSSCCQVCKFVTKMEDSVVLSVSMDDAIDGSINMPFTSRAAWHAIQLECPDLRRTHAHLIQGIRPLKKFTKVGDVKRYLRTVNDGVLIVRDNQPFQPPRERIVVPRSMVDVFLTTLHIRFCHPSRTQLKRISNRYFLALDFDKASEAISVACHQCQAVKSTPVYLRPQSSTQAPIVVGSSFAADVIHCYR